MMHLVVLFFGLLTSLNVSAIVAPPTDQLEKLANFFNQWKSIRSENYKKIKDYPMGWSNYSCTDDSVIGLPGSVNSLHPSQIDAIGTIGDSISLGFTAKSTSIYELNKSNPGVNFVSGNDVRLEEQATLFNIFNQFSPNLNGGSTDSHENNLNVAIAGGLSESLPQQAQKLADAFNKLYGNENENKWKFINIFIGHNDLCRICENNTNNSPESYSQFLHQALSTIRDKIPKSFVNVMPPINVYIHQSTHAQIPFCMEYHRLVCPCILTKTKAEYDEIHRQFDNAAQQAVQDMDDAQNDQFGVIYSPAIDIERLPEIDNTPVTALIAIDCFHLSPIAHDAAAKQVWRTLFDVTKTVVDIDNADFATPVCPPNGCPILRTLHNADNCTPIVDVAQRLQPIGFNGYPKDPRPLKSTFFVVSMFVVAAVCVALFAKTTLMPKEESNTEREHLLPRHNRNYENVF